MLHDIFHVSIKIDTQFFVMVKEVGTNTILLPLDLTPVAVVSLLMVLVVCPVYCAEHKPQVTTYTQ